MQAEAAALGHPMLPRPFRVSDIGQESSDTLTLELTPADGAPVPRFRPGQFNMLYAFGLGEVPISFSGHPAVEEAYIHTVRAVGPVSRALCSLGVGSTVGVRGPFGRGWPVSEAEGQDILIIAGGIGLAPLRPALWEVLDHRDRYGSVALLYGARSPRDLLFEQLLHDWRGRFDLQVEVTVDHAAAAWYGHVGVVTSLFSRVRFEPESATAFICGPEIMMRAAAFDLLNRGVDPAQVFISMERNMKCAIGWCGHCQLGGDFVCKDGPVFSWEDIGPRLSVREL